MYESKLLRTASIPFANSSTLNNDLSETTFPSSFTEVIAADDLSAISLNPVLVIADNACEDLFDALTSVYILFVAS
jgi:hypothetical protein